MENKQHRILIVGDSPFIHTGFGYLCREIAKYFYNENIPVANLALWDSRKNDEISTHNNINIPWPVYGCRTNDFDTYAQTSYLNILKKFRPTLILVITDIWIAKYFLDVGIRTIFYFHVEGGPLPVYTPFLRGAINWPETLLNCNHIVFAGPYGWGEAYKRLKNYIETKKLDINLDEVTKNWVTIPDGVNTKVFRPLDNKAKLKSELWGFKETDFVISFFGRQNPRKGLPYCLEAFAKWPNRPDNVYFYCHCPIKDKAGWDLIQMVKDLKIDNKVIINMSLRIEKGVTEEELNKFYNACDFIGSPSLGEGFGQTTCLAPGAIVKLKHGYVPIERVKPGDFVATHMGRFRKVKEVYETWYKGSTCKILTKDAPPFTLTPAHMVLTSKFKKASELKTGDTLRYPIMKEPKKLINAVEKLLNIEMYKPYKPFVSSKNPSVIFKYRDALYARKQSIFNVVKQKAKIWYLSLFKKIHPKRERYHDGKGKWFNKILSKIVKIEKHNYRGNVYNMNVEEDHSFLVNGVAAVHNCQALATATPVLIMDYSELSNFRSGTMVIKPAAMYIEPRTNIKRAIPGIKDIIKCYKRAYHMFKTDKLKSLGEAGYYDAQQYGWNKVGKKWVEYISSLPFTKENRLEAHFDSNKLASIVMTTYNSNPEYLRKAIASVVDQNYKNWELIICDDCSTTHEHDEVIKEFTNQFPNKIKWISTTKNLGTAGAETTGVQACTGDYIGFMDHDDMLRYNAVEETLEYLETNSEYSMVYTDEEEIDTHDFQTRTIYKEDYNEDFLLGVMYINHFRMYKSSVLKEFLPLKHSGAQDFDLTLRLSEKYKIGHIRKILYQWRKSETSTLSTIFDRKEVIENNKASVEDALKRRNIDATVEVGPMPTQWYINRKLTISDPVSIIILNKDKWHLLENCISSIEKYTEYPYEIILVDTGSTDKEVLKYLETTKHKVLHRKFNFSTCNNDASDLSQNKYICFLNNDTVVSKGWLTEIMKQLQRPEVAIVGPKLIFPNDKIQHAGLALGIQGLAHHMWIGAPKTYWNVNIVREVSAVTGACLTIKKDVFEKAGKFDPLYKIEFQDVDLCLAVRSLGYKIMYTPKAEIVHYTSQTRGNPTELEAVNDRSRFTHKWHTWIEGKIDYNLHNDHIDINNDKHIKYWLAMYEKVKQAKEMYNAQYNNTNI